MTHSSKLSSMSKEEKINLLEAIKEKKRRIRKKKDIFKPHDGQMRIIKSNAKNKWVFCSNGFGKTALGSNIAKWHVEGYNPITKEYYKVPTTVTVLLDHPSKVAETWLPEIRKWMNIEEDQLKKNGKPYYNEIEFKNGSRILFYFHEQADMVFESTEFQVIIADEPFPRRIFIAMKRGMRSMGRDPYFYMFGTPISQRWLREDIHDKWIRGELLDTECFTGTIEDNRDNLREGYIEEFSQYLTEEEKQIRLEGRFFDLGGLALAHLFNRKTGLISRKQFDKIWDKRNPCVVAVDPHPSKKHVAILLGIDRNEQLYYIKEIARKEIAREFAATILREFSGYKIIDYVCDSLGSTDYTGGEGFKSFIEVCNDVMGRGRMRATTYKEKSDEDFIEKIRHVLKIPTLPNNFGQRPPKLLIVEDNDGIIKDIENVSWQRDRDGNVKDKLDIADHDFLACLKYGLASNLHFSRARQTAHSYTRSTKVYGFGR